MKKRLISILLTVLMVMSMFTGMSVSAYADDVIDSSYYKEYQLVAGDYVLRICQKMGINYYTCKEAIMALNNITSENGFRYLSVGSTVKIPVSDAAAVAIMTGKANGSTGSSGSTGSTNSGAASNVSYYLIPYTMQRGETVLGVCNSFGINFTANQELIKSVNGIKSWNAVNAGKTILLPSVQTPAVGTTCYAVTGHKIASGETTYGICQNYGVNYNSNTKLLEALNPKTNFTNIKAGATMFLPVVTTIKAQTNTNTGNTNTGNTNNGSNTADKNNSNTTTVKTFELNANINTTYGTMKFYVDNKEVSTAAEGDKVTVDVTTKDSRAVDSVVVKYEDGRADLNLESNTFIMPGCDVRVDANIQTGFDITINSNYSFKTAAQVSGISVSSATEGSSVKIVSTDPGYAVKEVEAYYSTLWGIKKTVLTVNDQNCFTMPKKDVTVDVTLAPVQTYSFFRNDVKDGSFDLQVDGFSVSKAAKGARVTVLWQPMAGYEIGYINVYKADNTGKYDPADTINVFNNSFTMPACPVYVEVEFKSCENAVSIEAIEGGVLYATLGASTDAHVSEAETGETVYIYGEGRLDGYTSAIKELVVIRKADGHRVSVNENNGSYSFDMPAGGVTVSGKLVSEEEHTVTIKFNSTGSENRVTVKADGVENWNVYDNSDPSLITHNYAVGTKLNFSTLARETHAFNKFEVYVNGSAAADDELSAELNTTGSINMPDADLEIKAVFKADEIALDPVKVIGNGRASYQVNGKSALSAKVGDTVTVVASSNDPNLPVKVENITVTAKNKDNTQLTVTETSVGYAFKMPPEGVSVTVKLEGVERVLTLKTVDETEVNAKVLQGDNLWGMYIDTQSPADKIYENSKSAAGTKVDIRSGDAVIIFFESALTSKYNIDRVEMTSSTGKVHEGGLEYNQGSYRFFMANENLTVTVYVKDKNTKTHSLLDISYPTDKMTVGCTVGKIDNSVVTTAKVGEVVYVLPKMHDDNKFELERDGLTVTKKSSDNIGRGTFTMGADNVPNADMLENKFYPAVDSTGKVIGWKYIMPEGGVNVSVAASAKPYDITLSVKDTNGNVTAADGTKLDAAGYVVINTTESNVTTARQVANGKVEDVKYGQAVVVSLSEAGSKLYKLKSVAVADVTINNNNGFWMPAKDITLEIVLEPKEVAPTKVNIKTASLSNGSIQYYADAACTQLIPDNKAEVGKYIYAVATPSTGYQLGNFSAINSNDKTVIADMTKGNEGNGKFSILVPEHDINVSAAFEVVTYTLTINLEVDAHAEQVKVQVGNGTINTVTSKNMTVPVPYNSTVKLTVVNTNEFNLVDSHVKADDPSVAAVSVSKNASSASFKMPASNASVAVDLNSK